MIKIKSLLPILRERNRYLAFEIISDHKIRDFKAVSGRIMRTYSELFGDFGTARANILVMADKWHQGKQKGIIKLNHKHVHELKSALAFIDKIKNKNVIVNCTGLSGTLKHFN